VNFDDYAGLLRASRTVAGRPLVVFASLPSTNDMGKRLAREYLREGRNVPACDLVAWEQTAGRGRGEHEWSSPTGAGVWATLLRPVASLREIQEFPMRVGVGLHRVLDRMTNRRCCLKWPNDLMVAKRKLGGVLIETVVIGDQAAAILGFGINHTTRLDRIDAPAPASVMDEVTTEVSLAALTVELIRSVDRSLEDPAGDVLAAYRDASAHQPGDRMRCRSEAGELVGALVGFERDGRLRLETAEGEIVITAAEIIQDDS